MGGHDDDRGNAVPPGRDRHALRVIPRRKGHDSARAFLVRQLEQPVGRSPKFERMPRLQAFAFEPDSGPPDLAFDQWRSLDKAGDSRRRLDHCIPGDGLLIR
jgi:hypothetical protein